MFRCTAKGEASGKTYAVKRVHPRTEAGTQRLVTSMASLRWVRLGTFLQGAGHFLLCREVKLLKELRHHPNIIELIDVYLSWEESGNHTMHIVFEYGADPCACCRCVIVFVQLTCPLCAQRTRIWPI